jgi:hypothetical protein
LVITPEGRVFGQGQLLQMLEGDPIELAKMILALGDLLQRTFSDGLSLRSGAVSISDDLSEPVRVGSAAPWRSAMLLREAKFKTRCVPAFSCEQRATKAGHV